MWLFSFCLVTFLSKLFCRFALYMNFLILDAVNPAPPPAPAQNGNSGSLLGTVAEGMSYVSLRFFIRHMYILVLN